MSKIKTIPASSLEDRCNRLECITEMVYALHVAEAEGDGLPRGGYSLALLGVHDDLLALLGDLQGLYMEDETAEGEGTR